MGDIGDLSDFLKEGELSDLNWLDIDESKAQDFEKLPKQNLDFSAELEAQWSKTDPAATQLVPNIGIREAQVLSNPQVDLGSAILRTARLALTQSTDTARWQDVMKSTYAQSDLVQHRTALSQALAERGLLGGYYIDAADYPKCATSKTPSEFVRRFASTAKFVRQKSACGDCSHNQNGRCGVFLKELVQDIPYTQVLAKQVIREQSARGFTASVGASPKATIQSAYLNRMASATEGQFTGQTNAAALIPASSLVRKSADDEAKAQQEVQASVARPIVELVRRELLKGRTASEVSESLRLAFDVPVLRKTQQYWAPLFKQSGLYGAVYSTQDSFSDCREGADFLSKYSSKVRAIVAGDKCSGCIYNKISSCMLYGRKLVASLDEVYTAETVAAVLDEHKMAGDIAPHLVNQDWGSTPQEALKNIHKAASSETSITHAQSRASVQEAFYGSRHEARVKEDTKLAIVKAASEYLNEGLYGEELGNLLLDRFDSKDLIAAAPELRTAMAEQGLQGIYFVDPSIYDDYGHGCHMAQRKHRSRSAVEYVKAGDKCGSCVHQSGGKCSVLNKKLAREIPYIDKMAQQKAILASGLSTKVDPASLVKSSASIVHEFQVTGNYVDIELNPEAEDKIGSIELGNNTVDVSKL